MLKYSSIRVFVTIGARSRDMRIVIVESREEGLRANLRRSEVEVRVAIVARNVLESDPGLVSAIFSIIFCT